jgi:polyhydroxyalkanoate synthesis repressor PhaR
VTEQRASDRAAATSPDKPKKVIKRYANRKLYDTERSCYVTLEEISQMIKEGEEIQVVDNKSKEDLTAVTLAQIIVEEEKKVARMPLKLLRSIIQSSNDALGGFFEKHVADPARSLREDVERRVDGLLRRDAKDGGKDASADAPTAAPVDEKAAGAKDGAAKDGAAKDSAAKDSAAKDSAAKDSATKDNAVRAFVASTTEAFEGVQKRIDEQVKDAMSKMTHLASSGADVDALKRRIAELEERLARLEK